MRWTKHYSNWPQTRSMHRTVCWEIETSIPKNWKSWKSDRRWPSRVLRRALFLWLSRRGSSGTEVLGVKITEIHWHKLWSWMKKRTKWGELLKCLQNLSTYGKSSVKGPFPFLGTSSSSSALMDREIFLTVLSFASTRKQAQTNSPLPVALDGMTSINPWEGTQEIPSSSALDLSSATKEACQKVLAGVKSLCEIYDVLVQELLHVVGQSVEEIREGSMLFFVIILTKPARLQSLLMKILNG